jgi:hypothetical protein
MGLIWLDPDHLVDRDVVGAVALLDAARLVDSPLELVGPTVFSFTTGLRHGWDGDPPLAAVAAMARNSVVAVLNVGLPHWDNTHVGYLHVTFDPLARRQGIGRRLFEAGVEQARAESRTLVLSDCWSDSSGVEFARATGLEKASVFVARRRKLRARLGEAGPPRERQRGRVDGRPNARPASRCRGHPNDFEVIRLDQPTSSVFPARVVANDVLQAPQDLALFVSGTVRSKVERTL